MKDFWTWYGKLPTLDRCLVGLGIILAVAVAASIVIPLIQLLINSGIHWFWASIAPWLFLYFGVGLGLSAFKPTKPLACLWWKGGNWLFTSLCLLIARLFGYTPKKKKKKKPDSGDGDGDDDDDDS